MLPLRWTELAVTQLEGIVDYISATSLIYAEGVVLRIDQRLQTAREHPEIGRQVARELRKERDGIPRFSAHNNTPGRIGPEYAAFGSRYE